MEIRAARKEDLKDISEIFRTESSKEPYIQRWTKKTALEEIKDFFKKRKIYIVLIEKEIIGFVVCERNESKKTVYINELWIKAKNQGQGIGTQLMNYIEENYKKDGIKTISLVSDNRSRAFDFYKKRGYKLHSVNVFLEKEL